MSAAAHTPGPWEVHVEPEHNIGRTNSVYICSEGGWPEAQLARVNVQDELGAQAANARLIAAAPQLYDALRELLIAVTFSEPPVNMGGTEDDPNLCYDARVPVDFVTNARAALSKAKGDQQ